MNTPRLFFKNKTNNEEFDLINRDGCYLRKKLSGLYAIRAINQITRQFVEFEIDLGDFEFVIDSKDK